MASFAFQSGVPVQLIKMLGDWKSDSVLLYLTVPLSIRLQSINPLRAADFSTHLSRAKEEFSQNN